MDTRTYPSGCLVPQGKQSSQTRSREGKRNVESFARLHIVPICTVHIPPSRDAVRACLLLYRYCSVSRWKSNHRLKQTKLLPEDIAGSATIARSGSHCSHCTRVNATLAAMDW